MKTQPNLKIYQSKIFRIPSRIPSQLQTNCVRMLYVRLRQSWAWLPPSSSPSPESGCPVSNGQHGQSVTVYGLEWRWPNVRGAGRLGRKWTSSITRENGVRLRGRREIHAAGWRHQRVAEFQRWIDRRIPRYRFTSRARHSLCSADSNFCPAIIFPPMRLATTPRVRLDISSVFSRVS